MCANVETRPCAHGRKEVLMIDDELTMCGIKDRTGAVMIDGSPAKLVERALSRREGKLTPAPST